MSDATDRLRRRVRELRDLTMPLDTIAAVVGVHVQRVAELLGEGMPPEPAKTALEVVEGIAGVIK